MDARDQNGMTETEFLRQYDPDRYEKPAVTVDMLIFTVNPERDYSLELLMIERGGFKVQNAAFADAGSFSLL